MLFRLTAAFFLFLISSCVTTQSTSAKPFDGLSILAYTVAINNPDGVAIAALSMDVIDEVKRETLRFVVSQSEIKDIEENKFHTLLFSVPPGLYRVSQKTTITIASGSSQGAKHTGFSMDLKANDILPVVKVGVREVSHVSVIKLDLKMKKNIEPIEVHVTYHTPLGKPVSEELKLECTARKEWKCLYFDAPRERGGIPLLRTL